ncbi:unnamed protein product [Mytilus edulis]|uniref:Uncharacterized protein n=2 Tax=Mytilus edulis TaxID=6550 RepID=A0A8S3U940_MYTED|nr:unnamed protein product [Mytilus edulis]
MPQSKSILNIGYDEAFEISVQNEDYDHIERIGRRTDVDMVYSLTSYQKSEDDYDISAIIVSIIAILCIVGLIYLYKRKYNPTWCSKADTNSAMSIQDRPQQKDEHDYMTVYDIDAPQHENPSFVIEQNKDKNYDKLRRPDQDTNDYDKLQESTSQKYENSAKKHKLNTDLANQLQESLKYENSETNATKDFKSQSNLGESIASKLYESIDNCNSDSLTESTPYAYIE